VTLGRAHLLEQLPANAEYPDVQGAAVTAQHFAELYGAILRTGDTELWEALSGPDCDFCADSAALAKEYADSGSTVTGAQVEIVDDRVRGNLKEDGFTYIGLVVHQEPIVVLEVDGTKNESDGGEFGLAFQMLFVDGAWQVQGVQVVTPDEIPR